MSSVLLGNSMNLKQQLFPYANFAQAKQALSTIEAIDYFLAKQLCESLLTRPNDVFAHLMLYLSVSVREGHSCLPIKKVAAHHWAYTTDNDGVIMQQGFVFPEHKQLQQTLQTLSLAADNLSPVVFTRDALYLRRFYQFEQYLSEAISQRVAVTQLFDVDAIHKAVEFVFPRDSEQSAETKETAIDWQKIAVANALNKNFTIIAGGPGTGKTYTVTKLLAAIIKLHQQKGEQVLPLNIAMVAPTGKAAQRLSESISNTVAAFKTQFSEHKEQAIFSAIPTQASTLHRLLGVIPNQNQFKHNEHHLLPCDVLLVDEVSMVDLALFTRLFKALKPSCKLILLGDAQQLPAVLTGNVLADIAVLPHQGFSRQNADYLTKVTQQAAPVNASKPCDYLTVLQKSRRFDSEGGIGQLASQVINGQSKVSWSLLANHSATTQTTTLLQGDEKSWLLPLVKQYYLPLFSCNSVKEAFNLINHFRILCVVKQGSQSVEYYNELVKNILLQLGQKVLPENYHSQPIMIEENNYQLGIFNGDIGFIWRHSNGQLMAAFEQANGEIKWLMISRLPKYSTVYAMTIHKTQGSEFTHVTMALPEQTDHPLLSRELIYTGLTRAKKQFSLCAKQSVWCEAIEKPVTRYSFLADLLADKIAQQSTNKSI
jgi:exodeoxyribonuclease V alpha subunit